MYLFQLLWWCDIGPFGTINYKLFPSQKRFLAIQGFFEDCVISNSFFQDILVVIAS